MAAAMVRQSDLNCIAVTTFVTREMSRSESGWSAAARMPALAGVIRRSALT
ncbi:MAG: hypothetical protein ACRDSP_16670 [Pseudonocardiaceae bacterium]